MLDGQSEFKVPEFLATRARGRQVREEAVAAGARVLDFSQTWMLSVAAADELVCNGSWEATTGESPEIREKVERALKRRGMLP
jgi:hypothetical protein